MELFGLLIGMVIIIVLLGLAFFFGLIGTILKGPKPHEGSKRFPET